MAHCSQEFALVGYSENLERRPLKFVEPIPTAQICSACGNIPRLTYTLLCGHTLCEPCYQSCVTTSECVCPLDGDVCVTTAVTSKEYPVENLLKREVHCWNEAHGCGAILPASQIAEHVRRDCQHHVIRCPTCLAAVLSRDVCAHLKSRCTALVLHAAHEAQPKVEDSERTHLMAFEKKIERQVRELDAKLAQLSRESAWQSDKLVELCHNNNRLKEELTEQYEQASGQTLHRLDRNEAEMKALVKCEKTIEQRVGELDTKLAQLSLESGLQQDQLIEVSRHIKNFSEASGRIIAEVKALYSEKSESLMTAIMSVLASIHSGPTTDKLVVSGYAALKREARKEAWSVFMSEKVYLQGYLMSWGINFRSDGECVYLCLRLHLHRGINDEFLQWPFKKQLKLSIIHPETRGERHYLVAPRLSEATKTSYSRPVRDSNIPVILPATEIETSNIERDGYVKSDQLFLRLEVLL